MASLILLVPQLLIQRLEPLLVLNMNTDNPEEIINIAYVCVEYFPKEWMVIAYTVFFYVLLYLVPVVTMCVCYGKIAYTLWIRNQPGEQSKSQDTQRWVGEKRRIIRMLVVIVALFTICWFPFFTGQIYLLFCQGGALHGASLRITIAFLQVIGYSNCCFNPIVYCLLSASFRQHFMHAVCVSLRRLTNQKSKTSQDTSRVQPIITTSQHLWN